MDLEKSRKALNERELIIEYNLIDKEDFEMVLKGLRLFRDLGADIDLEEAVKTLSDGKRGGTVKFSFYGEQFEFTRYDCDDDLEPVGSSISVTRIVGDKGKTTEEPSHERKEDASEEEKYKRMASRVTLVDCGLYELKRLTGTLSFDYCIIGLKPELDLNSIRTGVVSRAPCHDNDGRLVGENIVSLREGMRTALDNGLEYLVDVRFDRGVSPFEVVVTGIPVKRVYDDV